MAINPYQLYPDNMDAPNSSYPHGRPRNRSGDTATDGFGLEERWLQCLFGFLEAIQAAAGGTRNGNPDTATASQYLTWLRSLSVPLERLAAGVSSLTGANTRIDISNAGDSSRLSASQVYNLLTGTTFGKMTSMIDGALRHIWTDGPTVVSSVSSFNIEVDIPIGDLGLYSIDAGNLYSQAVLLEPSTSMEIEGVPFGTKVHNAALWMHDSAGDEDPRNIPVSCRWREVNSNLALYHGIGFFATHTGDSISLSDYTSATLFLSIDPSEID